MTKINSLKGCFLYITIAGLLLTFGGCTRQKSEPQKEKSQIDSIITACKDTVSLSLWVARMTASGNIQGAMLLKKEKGNLLFDRAMLHESVLSYYEALKDARLINDTSETIRILNKIGKVFYRMGFADEAVDCHQEALEFCNKYGVRNSKEHDGLYARTYTGLGNAYLILGDNKKAIDNLQRSMDIEVKQSNYKGQAVNYVGLGMAMENEGKYDSAENYFNLALECDIKENNRAGIITCHNRFGHLAEKKEDWSRALQEYGQSYKIAKSINDVYQYIEASLYLARVHFKIGDIETSRNYLQTAIENANSSDAYMSLSKAYQLLSQCDEQQGLNSALDHYKKSVGFRDSINNERKLLGTQRFLVDYEKEKGKKMLDAMRQGFKSKEKKKDYILLIAGTVILLGVGLVITMAYALKQRNLSQKLQANMEKMRSDFFTNITHEFRTPLTIINGISEHLKQKAESPEDKQQLDIVERQGQQLLALVNQLLDISKIQSAVGNPVWHEGDIVAILEMAIESMNVLAIKKKIDIVFVKGDANIIMDLVPDYINKILGNLLANAIKYTPNGGKIVVRVKQKGAQVSITFFDNGSGISEEELSFVFDKYYQGNLHHGHIGTGLGLSMVRQMTEAMGGSIEVYSVPGRGTAFEITLPQKHSQENFKRWDPRKPFEETQVAPFPVPVFQIESLFPDDHMIDARKPSVLVVEDNADVATYIGTILTSEYNLRYAKNGKEALEKMDEFIIDIIVSDIIMPEMDGFEMVRKIRSSDKHGHIPIVIITAKNEEKDRMEALKAGADIYLLKPFIPEELLLGLSKLLQQRQQLREVYGNEAIVGLEDDTVNYDHRNIFLSKLHEVVHSEMNDTSFNSLMLASKMCMSRSQLNRKVKKETGKDTSTFIREQRLLMAHKLLRTTEIPISDIVIKCGFEYQTYFNRVYKIKYGETPTQTREKNIRITHNVNT